MSPMINNIGFGADGHIQKSENHENDGFGGSPKMKSKSYYSKTKQNKSTELSNIYNRNAPPRPPRPPNPGFFPDFTDFL